MSAPSRLHVAPGDRFGRGVIVAETRIGNERGAVLACDCGAEYTARIKQLFSRTKQSCGCLRREEVIKRNTTPGTHPAITHGLTNHPSYARWKTMVARCENPAHQDFKWYGAKGVHVHSEWRDAVVFLNYLDNTLGACPLGHSLDRIDPNGHYEPGNIRWADWSTQRRNRR